MSQLLLMYLYGSRKWGEGATATGRGSLGKYGGSKEEDWATGRRFGYRDKTEDLILHI